MWQYKQRNKKFDYTAITDRLRVVSWSYYCNSHPTCVLTVFDLQGPTFQLAALAV